MAGAIRSTLTDLGFDDRGRSIAILYGGSVSSSNIDEFMTEPAIDGALVGGASLKPDEMAAIVARAGLTAAARGRDPAGSDQPIVLLIIDGFGIGSDPRADAIAAARMPSWRGLMERGPMPGSGPPVRRSACRRDRWGTRRSGTSTSGPGGRCSRTCHGSTRPSMTGRSSNGPPGRCVRAGDRRQRDAAHRQPGRPRWRPRGPSPRGPGGAGGRRGVARVRVHALLDGRDTPPASALGFVEDLEDRLAAAHADARIATVGAATSPWIVTGAGTGPRRATTRSSTPPDSTPSTRGDRGRVRPRRDRRVHDADGHRGADGIVLDGDVLVHANFRADRARQLTRASPTTRSTRSTDVAVGSPWRPVGPLVVTMTEYEAGLPVEVAFPPEVVPCLSGAISAAGWRQLHVAETEKYAHVTYFLNGGREAPFEGEDRVLIPSLGSRPTTSSPR